MAPLDVQNRVTAVAQLYQTYVVLASTFCLEAEFLDVCSSAATCFASRGVHPSKAQISIYLPKALIYIFLKMLIIEYDIVL